MSYPWKQHPAQDAPRSVRAVARRRYPVIAAAVLAVAMGVVLAPRTLSYAGITTDAGAASTAQPNDDGLTWTPATDPPDQASDPDGCYLTASDTVAVQDHSFASEIYGTLKAEGSTEVNSEGIADLGLVVQTAPTGTSFEVESNADVDCALENQGTAYIKRHGYDSLGQYGRAVLDAYLHPAPAGTRLRAEQRKAALLAYDAPAWLKSAIAAIAGVVVYTAISVLAVAAVSALGLTATPIVAGFAGCLGGAVAVPLVLVLAGVQGSALTGLAAPILGCITGIGATTKIPVATIGKWLGAAFRPLVAGGTNAILGGPIVADLTTSEIALPPIGQAMDATLSVFSNV